ncbi:hypothetical protein A9Q84_01745 [Halobacteriovorax marinus]|uniref:Peptidase U32 collagenase domain-containing protein n=1 Tax=Halobacteriovorax marinus TaxID=97084 RepID=A0A1Y5FHU6_9BACT|nr:hypothetical protein A9Q84_01745 [Halobacteriovorax marinus]
MSYTPELLLPVGNLDMCLAAIHNGADAIYVGMPEFNARGRTTDHTFEQLEEMIKLCHLYGVRVNVAFNILIFQSELERAKELIEKLLPLSPDAIIVQDLGLVKLIKAMAPKQIIHASTQMTITNEYAIDLTRDLDIKRYVLGRENSLDEIKKIKDATDKELEVFVHGALCVAYSGQCFTSESIGGRSANRGQCAQSCRFEYDLIVDGVKKDLVDKKYLVSPQDLCGIDEIAKLKELKIDSFKVEGRLKSPLYVASAASSYRQALDETGDNKKLKEEMAITYSRGFFPGWLNGVDHQDLVNGTFGDNRGLKIGQIQEIKRNAIVIASDYPVQKGDGLLFTGFGKKSVIEFGTMIYGVYKFKNKRYELKFSKDFKIDNLRVGNDVYLTSSPSVSKELAKTFSDKSLLKRRDIQVSFKAHIGSPMELMVTLDETTISVKSEAVLEAAKREPKLEDIKKELCALSASAFKSDDVQIDLSNPTPFIHNKTLKLLRQSAIATLSEALLNRKSSDLNEFTLPIEYSEIETKDSKIRLMLREKAQVESLLSYLDDSPNVKEILDSIILDFEFGKDYKSSLELVRGSGIRCGVATNRILKPGEYHHLKVLIRLKPDYVLVRNLGAKEFFSKFAPELETCGDFSLNISNSISADYLFKKGLTTITPSYDLNEEQLIEMINHSKNKNFEITLHQYMPSFHMEHCVFAAFLSKGKSFRDCGKPCEKHKVELHDSFGNKHFIKADQECRNTMYNATPISAPTMLKKCHDLGVNLFRIEALFESGSVIFERLETYRELINGEIDSEELNLRLGQIETYGLSSGQLFKKDSYQDRKKF